MYVRTDSDALYKQKGQQVLISWKLKRAKIDFIYDKSKEGQVRSSSWLE